MTSAIERTVTTPAYQPYIKASPAAIATRSPRAAWTPRYGCGERVAYELHTGGAYGAYATKELEMGAPDVIIEGEVVEADLPQKLVQDRGRGVGFLRSPGEAPGAVLRTPTLSARRPGPVR